MAVSPAVLGPLYSHRHFRYGVVRQPAPPDPDSSLSTRDPSQCSTATSTSPSNGPGHRTGPRWPAKDLRGGDCRRTALPSSGWLVFSAKTIAWTSSVSPMVTGHARTLRSQLRRRCRDGSWSSHESMASISCGRSRRSAQTPRTLVLTSSRRLASPPSHDRWCCWRSAKEYLSRSDQGCGCISTSRYYGSVQRSGSMGSLR